MRGGRADQSIKIVLTFSGVTPMAAAACTRSSSTPRMILSASPTTSSRCATSRASCAVDGAKSASAIVWPSRRPSSNREPGRHAPCADSGTDAARDRSADRTEVSRPDGG